jgi:hypothetical protein
LHFTRLRILVVGLCGAGELGGLFLPRRKKKEKEEEEEEERGVSPQDLRWLPRSEP